MHRLFGLIIAGSRTYDNRDHIMSVVEPFIREKQAEGFEVVIVSGNARGADKAGEYVARCLHLDLVIMPANWSGRLRSAGSFRNKLMAHFVQRACADSACFIFRKDFSKGSTNMIHTAARHEISTHLYEV